MNPDLLIFKQSSNQIWQNNSQNYTEITHQPSIQLLEINQEKSLVCLKYGQIESTMTPAEHWPQPYLNNFTFAFQADSQISGKGQGSNSWSSPPGNVYLTILTKIKPNIASFLSMLACSAVMKTIVQQIPHLLVQCKWINDVFIADKKVAGLLTSCSISGQNYYGTIGIGINIRSAPIEGSTFLQRHQKEEIDLDKFTVRLIKNILTCLQTKEESLLQYQQSLMFLGQEVTIFDKELKNILHEGIFRGVNELGHALLEEQGKEISVHMGRMREKRTVVSVEEKMLSSMAEEGSKRSSYLI